MNSRQKSILQSIVESYIKTAEPVGSKSLANNGDFKVSPATIRNDMVVLEQEGFIRAPHTSAGRVPTEQGYEYYLSNIGLIGPMRPISPTRAFKQVATTASTPEDAVKSVAKKLVDLSGEMALVAFDPNWSYYTGLSKLFSKPDFSQLGLSCELSQMLDQFDEVINTLFEHMPQAPQVMIGSQNPFGRRMSSIMVKYELPNDTQVLLGLVGPIRMDYKKNIALLEEAIESLSEVEYE
jgi:heat-inducible transcriptional repressor